MATIPPGGIVTVPDASGGAGAPLLTSQIVNAAWQNGQQRTIDAANRVDSAIALAGPAPLINTPALDTSYVPPISPGLVPSDPSDAKAIYDDTNAEITQKIEDGFADFQATYFPDIQPAADAALAWLLKSLTTGGTGIGAGTEAQIWERDRARILGESGRAEAEAFSTFANRGFPLPPGALVSGLMQIRKAANDQLAAQSRDIAIKTADTEIENARLAVQQATGLRISALAAAGDYIKTLILGPQTAMQLATGFVGLRNDFNRTLVSLYQAQSAALDPRVRLSIADADLKMRGQEANQRSQLAIIEAKVRAALEAAQQLATQAAGLLNGIHAGVSISGQDSTST
ncbi:hypothetical protein VLK31_07175 [Variovorax sp. H27-G14]|uniref:hypothetical protein n=1 Tax=Variovorax sp. H27-G14 TaxID=3111914 RepID=UPI0038FC463A